nr:endocuticle structural glycoprotein SgAbd-2-like [Anopheles coluzzii]
MVRQCTVCIQSQTSSTLAAQQSPTSSTSTKMKMFVALFAVFAVASAIGDYHHQPTGAPIKIVHSESYHGHDGSYKFGYESANGIAAQEQGFVKNGGSKDHEVQVAHGYFSYTDPHGHPVSLSYVADEHGFQAKGSHIPTPPPVPQELVDAYAKAASQPAHHEEPQPHYAPQPTYKHY